MATKRKLQNKFDVLIAEDEEDLRELLIEEFLEIDPTLTVVGVENGFEAAAYCRRKKIRLLLSDLVMPVMTGAQLEIALQELPLIKRPQALVFMTAYLDKLKVFKNVAGYEVQRKPFPKGTIADLYSRYLKKEQENENSAELPEEEVA